MADEPVAATRKGFLIAFRPRAGGAVQMELESVDGARSVIEVAMSSQDVDVLERIFSDRPETWFEFRVREDGSVISYGNKACWAPRNTTLRGRLTSMGDLGDGLYSVGLADEEGDSGRKVALRRTDADIWAELMRAFSDNAVVEIDVGDDLSIQAIRRPSPE